MAHALAALACSATNSPCFALRSPPTLGAWQHQHIFFSTIPPPPRSTPFPYTTLFRSASVPRCLPRGQSTAATTPRVPFPTGRLRLRNAKAAPNTFRRRLRDRRPWQEREAGISISVSCPGHRIRPSHTPAGRPSPLGLRRFRLQVAATERSDNPDNRRHDRRRSDHLCGLF